MRALNHGGHMKIFAFFAVLLTTYAIQAATLDNTVIKNKNCAGQISEQNNIINILKQINPWGVWEGKSASGKIISVTLGTDTAGRFKGTASFDGHNVGPLGLTVCDYNGDYSLSISFFTIDFLIHSSKEIEMLYAFDGADSVILQKKSTKYLPL
jgi:type 1 fimbria pilin